MMLTFLATHTLYENNGMCQSSFVFEIFHGPADSSTLTDVPVQFSIYFVVYYLGNLCGCKIIKITIEIWQQMMSLNNAAVIVRGNT